MGFDPRTEARARILADSDNLAVVSTLEEAGGSLAVEALAERLVDGDVDVVCEAEYEDRFEEALLVLHHDRLPRLADVDLVAYDRESGEVHLDSAVPVDVEWEDGVLTDGIVDHLQPGCVDRDGTGMIEGRDAVLRYGRKLVDEAETELFTIYASSALLEDECVRRVERAMERGVRLSLGSTDPAVRDLARDAFPEATVWEPQHDWANRPALPCVGRLVFADRQKVMLAVLDESTADGAAPGETAIVGEGPTHPLVVLVRDLLGPRLDHLDFQSEDFANGLPS